MDPENQWILLPSGIYAHVADYKLHGVPEYDCNPLLQALPAVLEEHEFFERVQSYPSSTSEERNQSPRTRHQFVHRLTGPIPNLHFYHLTPNLKPVVNGYFHPLPEHIGIYDAINGAIMQGYIARGIYSPKDAERAQQIHGAAVQKAGHNLAQFISASSSAHGNILIGLSGCGKTTAVLRALSVYPQVIYHPEYDFLQLVYLVVNCPHAGSIKELCLFVFREVDRTFGLAGKKSYANKYSISTTSEGTLLAEVAAIADKYRLGLLFIDELQNLTAAKKELPERMLNYFVNLVNIGIPVFQAGTRRAAKLLRGSLSKARRAGGVQWGRILDKEDWSNFIQSLFESQWTRTPTPYTAEIGEAFVKECKFIPDLAIKLHKACQWRAIADGGDEIITAKLLGEVAQEIFINLRPLLDSIQDNNSENIDLYEDLLDNFDIEEFRETCSQKTKKRESDELHRRSKERRKKEEEIVLKQQFLTKALYELDETLDSFLVKACVEKALESNPKEEDLQSLITAAHKLALDSLVSKFSNVANKKQSKAVLEYRENDLRLITKKAQESNISEFEVLQSYGIFMDPVEKFLVQNG
ncbi:MAG: AAA family ATPase [Tildeniella nuda ZEHNDER 1965/U140]|jgi:hypothetical protein|nr:AAA family ATPase [Tildeniella nuda ZEHNDER 1965/U140]